MTTKYNRLFSLSVVHDFFKEGVIKSLSLRPDTLTTALLRNGQMLFRTLGSTSIVLFKADSDLTSPFIDLGREQHFRFYLTTERSDEFYNITQLDTTKKYVPGNKIHFKNVPTNASTDSNSPEVLTHTLIDKAFSKLFTYTFSLISTHTKTKFKMADSNGTLVSVGKDTDGNDLPTTLSLSRDDTKRFHSQVDLRSKKSGVYTITITNDSETTTLKEETVLIDNDGVQQGVLGIVDVIYDSATTHLYGATEFYEIRFSRKSTFWKYFIVNKTASLDLSDTATHLSIEDSPTGSGPPYVNVNFTRVGDEPHATRKVNGYDTVIFKSSAEIPSFETPKLNVQLVLKPSDKVMVEHLANPPVNTPEKENGGDIEKEIFVFI